MLKKVLIADGSFEYRRALADALSAKAQLMLCADGVQALELLRSFRPDYLVLDLMVTGVDGISVLNNAHADSLLPPTLATSLLFTPYMTAKLEQLGIGYAISKPCLPSAIVSRLEDMMAEAPPAAIPFPAPECSVGSLLRELGMNSSHSGFRYCRDAVMMLVDNPAMPVTKLVYPAIGKRCGTHAASVEKCIRDAIAAAWATGDRRVWARYFPGPNGQPYRPTNRVFLSTIAEILAQSGRIAR